MNDGDVHGDDDDKDYKNTLGIWGDLNLENVKVTYFIYFQDCGLLCTF